LKRYRISSVQEGSQGAAAALLAHTKRSGDPVDL
jgi:hypothetical protein